MASGLFPQSLALIPGPEVRVLIVRVVSWLSRIQQFRKMDIDEVVEASDVEDLEQGLCRREQVRCSWEWKAGQKPLLGENQLFASETALSVASRLPTRARGLGVVFQRAFQATFLPLRLPSVALLRQNHTLYKRQPMHLHCLQMPAHKASRRIGADKYMISTTMGYHYLRPQTRSLAISATEVRRKWRGKEARKRRKTCRTKAFDVYDCHERAYSLYAATT